MVQQKACTKCAEMKTLDSYTKAKRGKLGRASVCKSCSRQYYLLNRQRVIECSKKNYFKNPEAKKQYARNRYIANRDKLLEDCKSYRRTDRAKQLKSAFQARPERRIDNAVRIGVRRAFRGQRKSEPTWKMVGYDLEELVIHLEKQFLDGMNWDNYGKWHIDHIVPLVSFIGQDCPEIVIRKAWHLGNLRPCWAEENVSKNAKRIYLL